MLRKLAKMLNRDGATWLSALAQIDHYTIVVCLIWFYYFYTEKFRVFVKHSEKIHRVFGKRPNISLALCSKFQLHDKKN